MIFHWPLVVAVARLATMQIGDDIHLGYCTNIHRGETWAETFAGLRNYTLRVKQRVSPDAPYGIGLRLSADAAAELTADTAKRDEFCRWLDDNGCYVFTINGFPYGKFHGERVKEQVFRPDWTSLERLDYTNQLFDLLDKIAPKAMAGSVSTLPGSFKEFISTNKTERAEQIAAIHKNLIACHRHIAELAERSGRDLHLGLEPEPLGHFETSSEAVDFFEGLWAAGEREGIAVNDLQRTIGVNYDTCHLAVQFEEPGEALQRLREAGIRVSKIHLSSALRLKPESDALQRLRTFEDEVYLHQVVVREDGEVVRRFRDLPDALDDAASRTQNSESLGEEWRVHFHVPIHSQPEALFGDTRDHISGTLAVLADHPDLCSHFEMETYTWEVLPKAMRSTDVVDQLQKEYQCCLAEFAQQGFQRS